MPRMPALLEELLTLGAGRRRLEASLCAHSTSFGRWHCVTEFNEYGKSRRRLRS